MTNYFRKPDALVDAVRAVLSGQPNATQEDIQRKADVKMVKVKLPDGRMVMRRERPKIEIGKGKNESLDPVDPKALKGKHKDRKDKDIDNDGDVDSSDKYLHKRRQAVSKAMKEEVELDDNGKKKKKMNGERDMNEGAFKGIGKTVTKAKLKYKKNRADKKWAYSDDEDESMKAGRKSSRYGKALDRLNREEDVNDDDKKKKVGKKGKKDEVDTEPSMDDQRMTAEMSDKQMKKREEIVKSMKKKSGDFKKRYGDRAKDVMYATATKMATKEGFELGIEKSEFIEEVELDEVGGSAFGGTIDKIQKVVDDKQAMKIDGVMVDTFTASLIMNIFNKVNKQNQDKMRKMKVTQLANAAYKLAGVKEEVELGEAKIAKKVPAKDGGHFVVLHRDTSGMRGTQDKFHMRHLKNGKVKDYGTHPSLDGALKFAKNRGIIEEVELDEAVKEYDVKIKVGSKTNSYNIIAKDELSAAQKVIHSVMARSRTGGSPGLDAVRKSFPDMKSLKKKGISVSIKEEVDGKD